jgi:hypothetical protein
MGLVARMGEGEVYTGFWWETGRNDTLLKIKA